MKLEKEIINFLKGKKSLLAFSYGSDSTALFHLLLSTRIDFDCAFVNYKTRSQSDVEEQSAREICAKFGKKIFIKTESLNLDENNFEHRARAVRLEFFDKICQENGYEVLMMAHQLNDKFEWFLMQLSKGSGVVNLLSLPQIQRGKSYFIVRPLIQISKEEILNFLHKNQIKYFDDNSNDDMKFTRNKIRKLHSDSFMTEFATGICKSFEMLERDKELLLEEFLYEDGECFIMKNSAKAVHLIDKACKNLGVVLSQAQRQECIKSSCAISGKIAIGYMDKLIIVLPYQKPIMEKKFKERCRVLKIPPILRGYLYTNSHLLDKIHHLIDR